MPLSLPVTDPVLIVAVAMTIFLVVPLLFERLGVPGMIGIIVAGAAVGPHGLHLLARDPTIVLLGTVGLLYLVFLAGLELDLNRFVQYRNRSLAFGLLSFFGPLALALLLMPPLGFGASATLLLGSIVGSHTLLAYPVASRLGLTRNAAVTTVVGGTLVTDALSLAILAVVAESTAGAAGPATWVRLFVVLAVYVGLVLWGVPRLGRWFFRNLPAQAPAEFIFLMVVLFVTAYLAGQAGAQPIIGAFLAGLALNRLIPQSGPLMSRTRFVGTSLFVPFFLLSVGMLVDVRVVVGSVRVWVIAAALLAAVLVGKLVGALATQRLFGYHADEAKLMFGLSIPQAAATLAVTFIGLDIGLFDETVVNAVIVMILVTVLAGPLVVEHAGRRVALRDEELPYDPGDAPERILVPVSNPRTADALLDLAFALRGSRSREPIYPLMVVREDPERAAARVAEAEKMLSHAVAYSAAADVPALPLTRVDPNVATGISRGMAERRTSTVVVGWDGRSGGLRHAIFGSVLDQLLEQTRQTVVVAKLGHPLNVTRRLVVVCPPAFDHHPGVFPAIRTVKTIAAELSASILVLTVAVPPERYERLFGETPPRVPSSFTRVHGWRTLLQELRTELRRDDLVVVLSSRRGTLVWHPMLDRLPTALASLIPESFLMLYPPRPESGAAPESPSPILAEALSPQRIVLDLPPEPFNVALATLLSASPPSGADMLLILADLERSERQYSTEVAPTVVVPHARVPGLDAAVLYLGISPTGIKFPNASAPAHLIFLLLTPPDEPETHLRVLSGIARAVHAPGCLEALRASRSPAELLRALHAAASAKDSR